MSSLALTRLQLRRAPGIRDSFELAELAPGVNVIHGPNASGKTATARAVEALVWPRTAESLTRLSGYFRLGDQDWMMELDGGQARYQCNGANAPAPALPPAESRDRYRLSLHELLAAEDKGLAAAIARESAGGFDLAAAVAALEKRTPPSGRNKKLDAFRAARGGLTSARDLQERLFADEQRLGEMDLRIAEVQTLGQRIRVLERAEEYVLARTDTEDARIALAGFPAELAGLRGDEAERIAALAEKLRDADAGVENARLKEQRAEAALAAVHVPDGGLPDDLLPSLRTRLQRLQELDHAIAGEQRKLSEAETRRTREGSALKGTLDVARLADLDTSGIRELAALAEQAGRLRAARAVTEERLRWLSSEGAAHDGRRLERGSIFLQQWLRALTVDDKHEARLRWLGLVTAGILFLASLLLAIIHPALALLALVAAYLAFAMRRRDAQVDSRAVARAEYQKLGLDGPTDWEPEAVERRLSELLTDLATARLEEERARRREEALLQLRDFEERESDLAAKRADLAPVLGFEVSDEEMSWLVERVGRWQEAHAEVEGAAAALATAGDQLTAALGEITEATAMFSDAELADIAAASGLIEALEERDRAYHLACAKLEAAREALTSAVKLTASLEAERRGIFAQLGLTEEDDATLRDWCERHAAYVEAVGAQRSAEYRRADLERKLTGTPGFEPALLEAAPDVLEAERAAAEARVAELQPIRDEAAGIRALVDEAKHGFALSDALDRVDEATAALRDARERDTQGAVAAALVKHVQNASRDQHLPAVFHRARDLFARITHGCYRLDFDDGDVAAFRAFDTEASVGRALDELSSATRIQLLLAVRLAFVESQETGVQLPLLMDETLGNSDDHRALAIMEAVLELAAHGRQILYFTAQPEEVRKWCGLLDSHPEIAARVVDLAATRRLAERLDLSEPGTVAPPARIIPEPREASHAEYGAALEVPRLDPFLGAEAAHLWYLMEDIEQLHRLLADEHVERWGALRTLAENGGRERLDRDNLLHVQTLARALDAALELLRVGCGRPVDRLVLAESGAVTGTFIDRVDEICRSFNGDGQRLVEYLEEGRLARFRASSTEALREYLAASGYLDLRDRLTPDEIRAGVLAAVSGEIEQALVSIEQVDRLLARIPIRALNEP